MRNSNLLTELIKLIEADLGDTRRHTTVRTYDDVRIVFYDLIVGLLPSLIDEINATVPGEPVAANKHFSRPLFRSSRQGTRVRPKTSPFDLSQQSMMVTDLLVPVDLTSHVSDPKQRYRNVISNLKDEQAVGSKIEEFLNHFLEVNGLDFNFNVVPLASWVQPRQLASHDATHDLRIYLAVDNIKNLGPKTLEKLEDITSTLKHNFVDKYHTEDRSTMSASAVLRDYLLERGHRPPNIDSELWVMQIISSTSRDGEEKSLALEAWREFKDNPVNVLEALIKHLAASNVTELPQQLCNALAAWLKVCVQRATDNPIPKDVLRYTTEVIRYMEHGNNKKELEDAYYMLDAVNSSLINFAAALHVMKDADLTNLNVNLYDLNDEVKHLPKETLLQIIKREVPDPSSLT